MSVFLFVNTTDHLFLKMMTFTFNSKKNSQIEQDLKLEFYYYNFYQQEFTISNHL